MAGICSLTLFELLTYHACPPSAFQVNWTQKGSFGDLFGDAQVYEDTPWKREHAQQLLGATLDLSVNWFISSNVPENVIATASRACSMALEGVEKSIDIWLNGTFEEPLVPSLKEKLVAGYARLYFSYATNVRYWSVVFQKQHKGNDTSKDFHNSICNSQMVQQVVGDEEDLVEFFRFNMSDEAYGS